jgi:uncharacterized protein
VPAPTVLIDTSAVYAFVTQDDPHHHEAVSFARDWLAQGGRFALLDVVFAETLTLLRARHGAKFSIRVGTELRRNPVYRWTPLGEEGEKNTWATFCQFDDKAWSFVNCALFATARREGTEGVFGFDRHLVQMPGLTRLPR